MKLKRTSLKSFRDLYSIKSELIKSIQVNSNKNEVETNKKDKVNYKNLTESQRSKWGPVLDLLEDQFFLDVANGSIKQISSKKYSTVTATLSYPTKADSIISQYDLDRAHGIAYIIKTGVNSGSIKYTEAKIPSTWRIAGNPGTKR